MRMLISDKGKSDSVKLFHFYCAQNTGRSTVNSKQRDVIWQLIVESSVRNVGYQCREVENSAYVAYFLVALHLWYVCFASFKFC